MKPILKHGFGILFILSAFFSSPVFAQIGFYEGYVVTNQNDSVFGKIDISESRHIIEYCILKKDGEDVKYYPDKVKRFGYFGGACYVTNILKDTVVQVLVEGKLSLYKLQSTLYIHKGKEKVTKLDSYTEKVIRNGEVYYVESVKWKGLLTYLTSDCNPGQDVIEKLHLLENELNEFVINYNKCTKSEYTHYKSK
jgi:hypothetical protein